MTYYRVAQNLICIETYKDENIDYILPSYKPFKISPKDNKTKEIVNITCYPYNSFQDIILENCILKTENDLGNTTIYKIENGYCIDICYQEGLSNHRMICTENFSICKAAVLLEEPFGKDVLNSFIMIAFSIRCTNFQTFLIHASSVMIGENAFAFSGVSGTGKSTHSNLWLKHILYTELLNDDHPVVRIMPNGEVHIFGSPWSGKTDCYKDKEKKLKGIILLKQAPKNEIRQLKGIESYFVVLNNSTKLRSNKEHIKQLGDLIETIVNKIPVYVLENLPNEEAALLSYETLSKTTKTN